MSVRPTKIELATAQRQRNHLSTTVLQHANAPVRPLRAIWPLRNIPLSFVGKQAQWDATDRATHGPPWPLTTSSCQRTTAAKWQPGDGIRFISSATHPR